MTYMTYEELVAAYHAGTWLVYVYGIIAGPCLVRCVGVLHDTERCDVQGPNYTMGIVFRSRLRIATPQDMLKYD